VETWKNVQLFNKKILHDLIDFARIAREIDGLVGEGFNESFLYHKKK
jgi:hypothetical protein